MRVRSMQPTNTRHGHRGARQRLLAKRAELAGHHRAQAGSLAALERVSDLDQARALHDEFVSVRVGRLVYEQLKLIDAALARLASGEYGVCIDCESPIPEKRLAAIPWAHRCVACQERATSEPSEDDVPAWAA